MVPETSKMIVRFPEALIAARSDPAPESFRFVTFRMEPPRPPGVFTPKPIALGNAFAGPLLPPEVLVRKDWSKEDPRFPAESLDFTLK